MSERLYRPVVRQAFEVSIKHKWLWFFGVFVALLGNGGIFNVVVNNFSDIQDEGDRLLRLQQYFTAGILADIYSNIANFFVNFNFWLLFVFVFSVLLSVFVIWIVYASYGSLIYAVSRQRSTRRANLETSWRKGHDLFWSVFGVNIFGKIFLYIAMIMMSVPFFILFAYKSSELWQSIWLLLLFLLLVPFTWVLSLVIRYATFYIAIEGDDIRKALQHGFDLFVRRWLVSIEMVVVIFLYSMLLFVGWFLVMAFISIPFILLILSFYFFKLTALSWAVLAFMIFTETVASVLIGAWFAVFRVSAWVYFFERISRGEVLSRITRWFSRIRS